MAQHNHATEITAETPSRRDFLKTSTAASAAALGTLAIGRSAHAAGSDVLKVGLIGCGGRGSGAAMNCMRADPSVRLVAMTDVFADRAQASRNHLRKAKPNQVAVDDGHLFSGLDGYKKVIESGVDLVLIACASRFHPPYLKAAIEAGKHCFCEKPNAIDPPGLRMILAASEEAKKRNLCVASGLMSRYSRPLREAIKRINDGAIGKIVAMEVNFLRSPYQIVARNQGWSEMEYQFRNWYHFSWLSGDDVIQSLVHNVDRASWAIGDVAPVKAHGLAGRSSMFGDRYGDVFDHHSVIYQYADGLRMYAFCRTQSNCYDEYSDIFIGTKGRCYFWPDRFTRIEGETNWRYQGENPNMYDQEHVEIVRSIRDGKPLNDGAHMAQSVLLGIMGQLTCYFGQELTLEQVAKSNFTFGPTDPLAISMTMDPPVKKIEGADNYPVPLPGLNKMER